MSELDDEGGLESLLVAMEIADGLSEEMGDSNSADQRRRYGREQMIKLRESKLVVAPSIMKLGRIYDPEAAERLMRILEGGRKRGGAEKWGRGEKPMREGGGREAPDRKLSRSPLSRVRIRRSPEGSPRMSPAKELVPVDESWLKPHPLLDRALEGELETLAERDMGSKKDMSFPPGFEPQPSRSPSSSPPNKPVGKQQRVYVRMSKGPQSSGGFSRRINYKENSRAGLSVSSKKPVPATEAVSQPSEIDRLFAVPSESECDHANFSAVSDETRAANARSLHSAGKPNCTVEKPCWSAEFTEKAVLSKGASNVVPDVDRSLEPRTATGMLETSKRIELLRSRFQKQESNAGDKRFVAAGIQTGGITVESMQRQGLHLNDVRVPSGNSEDPYAQESDHEKDEVILDPSVLSFFNYVKEMAISKQKRSPETSIEKTHPTTTPANPDWQYAVESSSGASSTPRSCQMRPPIPVVTTKLQATMGTTFSSKEFFKMFENPHGSAQTQPSVFQHSSFPSDSVPGFPGRTSPYASNLQSVHPASSSSGSDVPPIFDSSTFASPAAVSRSQMDPLHYGDLMNGLPLRQVSGLRSNVHVDSDYSRNQTRQGER